MMDSFKKLDSFEIAGRGMVIIVRNDRKREIGGHDYPVDKHVLIDGTEYKVLSIELHAIIRDSIAEGETMGLLVKKIEP
jgi:hypothetical protein